MISHTSKLAANGQITIPIAIRKQLALQPRDRLIFSVDAENRIMIDRVPTAKDWPLIVKDIPVEQVVMHSQGDTDAAKSPHFSQ